MAVSFREGSFLEITIGTSQSCPGNIWVGTHDFGCQAPKVWMRIGDSLEKVGGLEMQRFREP